MNKDNVKISSNRSFGLFFSLVFFIIAIWPIKNSGDIREWSLIISSILLILGATNSRLLNPLNKLWFKFGLLLGKVVSPIVMGIIFFLIVTPIGIFMRLLKKDLLRLKYNNSDTYWIEKDEKKSTMKNQF